MEASEKQREGSAMDQAGGTESGTIDSVLAHNRAFVAGGEFARYATDKYPDKKLAVATRRSSRWPAPRWRIPSAASCARC